MTSSRTVSRIRAVALAIVTVAVAISGLVVLGQRGSAPGAEALKARLDSQLELTELQKEELFSRVDEWFEARADRSRERRELLAGLRAILARGGSDAEITASLEAIDRTEAEACERDRELVGAIDDLLSVRQRAEFRLEAERFRRRVERRVREQRGSELPAPPAAEDDRESPR